MSLKWYISYSFRVGQGWDWELRRSKGRWALFRASHLLFLISGNRVGYFVQMELN